MFLSIVYQKSDQNIRLDGHESSFDIDRKVDFDIKK